MASGFMGSKEAWRRITAPLTDVDDLMRNFARRHGLEMTRDEGSWPGRSLRWGVDVQRLSQVFLADEKKLTFSVWVCAVQDGAGGRSWRRQF